MGMGIDKFIIKNLKLFKKRQKKIDYFIDDILINFIEKI